LAVSPGLRRVTLAPAWEAAFSPLLAGMARGLHTARVMHRKAISSLLGLLILISPSARATSVLSLPVDDRARAAGAICRGLVGASISYRDGRGHLWTQTEVTVEEALKGRFPSRLYLTHRGGRLNGEGETQSNLPLLNPGARLLLYLKLRPDGSAFVDDGQAGAVPEGPLQNLHLARLRALYPDATQAGADLSQGPAATPRRQANAVTGLLLHQDTGIPYRYTHGDRGEPIGYLVDMDALPSGISTNAARTAISNAFQAWADVTSLSFQYLGDESFGQAAIDVSASDGKIRIQTHDTYNQISGSSTLGVGGSGFTFTTSAGGDGGAVNGQKFHLSTRGYVTLKHTQATLSDPVALEEVLTHEIGHVLGMAHTSEPESIMQPNVYNDGRGAQLVAYDRTTVQQAYPTNNTPPAAFSRVMDAVTHFAGDPNVPGINEVEIVHYDLQSTNLTLSIVSTDGNGTFTLVGSTVKFARGQFSQAPRVDPLSGTYYSLARVVVSDGTNDSAFASVRVISLMPDQKPDSGSDGLPDDWMTQHFGNTDPAANPNFAASADFDNDGINNLDEFRIGTDPTDPNSKLAFIDPGQSEAVKFMSVPGQLYLLEVSTNLTNWLPATVPITATDTNHLVTNFFNLEGVSSGFFRLQRVP